MGFSLEAFFEQLIAMLADSAKDEAGDALREYAERALNAEDELEKANQRIAELEDYVASLERDLEQVDA